jgi:hypothetical protein
MDGFFVDTGTWTVSGGALQVTAGSLGQDAARVYYVDVLPADLLRGRGVDLGRQADRRLEGQRVRHLRLLQPTDFKFAGIDISTNKIVMGVRDATAGTSSRRRPSSSASTPGTSCCCRSTARRSR